MVPADRFAPQFRPASSSAGAAWSDGAAGGRDVALPSIARSPVPPSAAGSSSSLTMRHERRPLFSRDGSDVVHREVATPLASEVASMPAQSGTPSASVAQTAAPAGPDLDALVERACARVFETIAIEQERRGVMS